MTAAMTMFLVSALALTSPARAGEVNPIGKVLELLSSLEAKIIKEGEEAKKTYDNFEEWCEERTRNVGFEIKTGNSEVESLKATIEKQTAIVSSLRQKVEELAGGITSDESDLKAARGVRATEAASFAAEDKEMSEVIDTLDRAVAILSRDMQKGGASMLQLRNAKSVVQALSIMVQASAMSSADASRLTALVQSSQESDDTDAGAPDAAVYESKSGGIIETLQGLQEKAQEQLADARKHESTALHNFEMLQQSLEDEIKFANKGLAEAKKGIAVGSEAKTSATGELAVTSKDLEGDVAQLADLKHDCAVKAEDFQAVVKSRGEELKALADAKKVVSDMTGGAEKLSYGLDQLSFVQQSLSSSSDLAQFEAVRIIRDLARKQHSPILEQLATRIVSALRFGGGSGDPFSKVKALISDMITKLEDSAGADASHKAYCDEELKESGEKKVEKNALLDKLSTSIDLMTSKTALLKEQVAALQHALADIASSQADMDQLRQKERAEYVENKAELEQGIGGVQSALKILRDYYANDGKAHAAAEGAGSSVIGLLEVCLSDFMKGAAETQLTEETAEEAYDRATRENKLETSVKEQDVKYKSAESAHLDKAVAEAKSDRAAAHDELDAVLEYLAKLKEQCVAKAEPYAARKERRAAEIAGLKQALEILEGQGALLQRRLLRGVRPHATA